MGRSVVLLLLTIVLAAPGVTRPVRATQDPAPGTTPAPGSDADLPPLPEGESVFDTPTEVEQTPGTDEGEPVTLDPLSPEPSTTPDPTLDPAANVPALHNWSPSSLGADAPPPVPPGFLLGRSELVARFGWWASSPSGSPIKVGEYQSLSPSPFWDVDSISSNGRRTLDFWASGLDNETNNVRGRFYADGFRANVDFQRFIARGEYEPLSGGSALSNNYVVTENLNVGQDYAIRWDELNVGFREKLTPNITAKLQLWGLRRFGERQSNAMAHCFNINAGSQPTDNRCHVVAQSQQIDWLTMELEPGIEAKFKNITIDYTRTMRSFGQNDQVVTRPYTNFGPFGGNGTLTIFPYAIVPDSLFEMDRLKLGIDFSKELRLYSYLYDGNMQNQSRQTNRSIRGFDVRLIKTSASGVTATAYAKLSDTGNQLPPFLLPEERDDPSQILHPVDYTRFHTGLDGQWFPFRDVDPIWQRLTIRGGYEYSSIFRDYAAYPTNLATGYIKPPTVTNDIINAPVFVQPTTHYHQVSIGPWLRWKTGTDLFARYRLVLTDNPLYGLQPNSGALNANEPTFNNMVELGGAWAPASNLLLSARVSLQNTWLRSAYARFDENNFPFLLTAWYAPTNKLSLSAGYAYFTNWINQDINFGYRGLDQPPSAETIPTTFQGGSQVLNVGGRYQWSDRLLFTGGLVWNYGSNVYSVGQSQTGADWSSIPFYSNVIVQTMRYQAGLDYQLAPNILCYFRFNYFDFDDRTQDVNSGTSRFFLGGLTARF